MRKLEDIQGLIGNTPLVEIHYLYKGQPGKIYAKLEAMNFSGSIKDRMAYGILKEAIGRGDLKEGAPIIEATSGNTGISFCALGAYLGHPVEIYMPDWMSEERKQLISSFGAKIHLVSHEEGGFLGSIDLCRKRAKEDPEVFLPEQFTNEDNSKAQESLGEEILRQMKDLPQAFVAGVGTGGTVMGVGRAFKRANPQVKVHPLEPAESPTLSTGNQVGSHRIAGISDEFIPAICQLDQLDEVVAVHDGDAILMAQKLSQAGLGVGISSGGNFLGALKVALEMGPEAKVVTVFADDSKKYLSTDLLREEPVREGYLSKDLDLVSIQSL